MPWWGWLIAGCVGFMGLLWALVAVMGLRTVGKAQQNFGKMWDNLK